jgi:hypothetical protein
MRQEVLENMGWRFHRIWSTDWFYRRGETIRMLQSALEDARAAAPSSPPKQTAVAEPVSNACTKASPSSTSPQGNRPPYRLTERAVPPGVEPQLAPIAQMAAMTKAIVETEGPIHQDEIARRVASLFGKSRAGSLIGAASLKSLQSLAMSSILIEEDAFWMTPGQLADPPVRDRSLAPTGLQRADMVSPREIGAAARLATQDNGTLSDEEMAMAVSRLLGFKRTGPDLKTAIAKALHREKRTGHMGDASSLV